MTNCICYQEKGDWLELTQETAIVYEAIDKTVPLILCTPAGPLFDKIAFSIAGLTARDGLVVLISDPEGIERVGANAVQGTCAGHRPTAPSTIMAVARPAQPTKPASRN